MKRACRLARVQTHSRMETNMSKNHVSISRPAFTVDDAISGTLLAADCAPHIQSRTLKSAGYVGVRVEANGPAYVVSKSGNVIGLKRGEKLSPDTMQAIVEAVSSGAFVALDYTGCSKARNILTTSQHVADHWADTGKAVEETDTQRLVAAVQSAVISGKAGVSKPDQIQAILTDADDETVEASLTRLAAAVKEARKASSSKPKKESVSKSLTLKAVEALEALAKAIESGDLIPDAAEWTALVAASAQATAALKALEAPDKAA